MIKVDKTKYPDGTTVIIPSSLAKKKEYNGDDVKEALEKLFNGKCAYCESKYTHIMPMDVEHFRPKSIYPWLKFNWDNLLPSCIDCNRKRYQDIQTGKNEKAGKQDDFPLYNTTATLNAATEKSFDLAAEEKIRQLINPCIDNPEEQLKYDNKGFIYSKSTDSMDRGKHSIETFGLYRIELVKARKEHLLYVFACMNRVENLIKVIDKLIDISLDNPKIKPDLDLLINVLQANLNKDFKELKSYIKGDDKYTGMSRQYVNEYLKRIGVK